MTSHSKNHFAASKHSASELARAEDIVIGFTIAGAATGAIPVPGASLGIVAENTAMVGAIGAVFGHEVRAADLLAALSALGGINTVGHTIFIEGARAMGWFAGPLGVWGVSALGATTAALQTWTLGKLAIAYFEHGGQLSQHQASQVVDDARSEFDLHELHARHRAASKA